LHGKYPDNYTGFGIIHAMEYDPFGRYYHKMIKDIFPVKKAHELPVPLNQQITGE